ncbi:MAG: BamA/TamA family outer membrane protein [Lewinellaceae bacterium]|nr:BamA/TamA family outer membrane protein [Lewinellaceae bacterium]
MRNNLLCFFLAGLVFTSCANYKRHYAKSAANWSANQPDPGLKRTHTMYLIGDVGYLPETGDNPVLHYLTDNLPKAPASSSILFLGDNIYQRGLPDKTDKKNRAAAERNINAQLDALDGFKGEILFIPGNHDWGNGLAGVLRQEKYVEEYLNNKRGVSDDDEKGWKNYFVPNDGCSGPEVIELGDRLVVVAIDSEWYLTDWDKEPGINDGCDIKSRAHFMFEMENVLRKYRRHNVVIAMHHPPYTNGPHGGKHSLKEHIFPLTQLKPNLYIPLPGLGTLTAFLRASIGSKQDMANGAYKELMGAILPGARKNGSYIFATGHEHALQYLENDAQRFIVSGSGSKTSPVSLGKGSQFAYGAPGFSTIDFYENGEAWVHFWIPKDKGTGVEEVFRKRILPPSIPLDEEEVFDFSEYEKGLTTVEKTVIQDTLHAVGSVHKFVLGSHYRDVYLGTYEFPVLDLSTHLGGMTPIQQGGGNQTNSLRLKSASGHQYVLRDLTKDVSRLLPFPLNKMTAARSVALDNFLSTHPFAPLAIPILAEAAQVYHTNPRIVYVPKQPALGLYNENFGGSVYLFEERAGGDWSNMGVFGNSEKLISTPDLVAKTLKNNNHKIDQRWAVRSRLFDLVLGDWDRHDDQWRWARFKDGKRKFYRPVPRDRDQAFSKYDGLVTAISRQTMPFLRQLRVYSPTIPSMKWATWSARHFDRSFLNMMAWPEWQAEALYIQENLTDEVIEKAFAVWPKRAYDLSAATIIANLKARRDSIVSIAHRRYLLLSKEVDVYGTDEDELFEIIRESDNEVRVRVYETNKKGEKKDQVFERLFRADETKVINVYGIGDDDIFQVSGNVNQSIKVRLIGGQGKDLFTDNSQVTGADKLTLVYDDKEENTVQGDGETSDRRTNQRIYNLYDHRAAHNEYGYTVPLPILGMNPDDGFFIGLNLSRTTYKFKKDPYHAQHKFAGSFAFATNAWFLQYDTDVLNAFGSWDFMLESQFSAPSYVLNYFGFGNRSRADFETNKINYYRVRQSQVHLFPALKKRFAGNNGKFYFGPLFDVRDLEDTPDRYITSDAAGFTAEDFEVQYFGGAMTGLHFNSLDNWLNPHRGIAFNTTLRYLNDFGDSKYSFAALRTDLAIYKPLDLKESIVFRTRVGVQHIFGENFAFYHAPRLGGGETLRGYHAQRFYGKTAVWQNFDLSARLFSTYNRILPFTLGVFAGFDYGRVWAEEEVSENWNYDFGGGLWLAPLDGLTLYFGIFQPKQTNENGPRLFFRLGAGSDIKH